MLLQGPPNRILFVTDIRGIENFPFKIPMNKLTYLSVPQLEMLSDFPKIVSIFCRQKRAVVGRQESDNEIL